MFDTLDTLDWASLKTAYGTAAAIPAALRHLASPDEEVYIAAWQTLWSELEHQGTIFEASAYAVPFLLEWLSVLQSEEQCELVILLARLARGNSFKRQHLNLTDEQRKEDLVFQQEMAEEIGWVEMTHKAVRQGMELYVAFLNDQDLQLRMVTTYLLASFPEEHAQLTPLLQAYLAQETDQRMITCLLLSLGQLLPTTAYSFDLLIPFLATGNPPLMRFCAAMALSFLLKEAIPVEVVQVFFTFLTDPGSVQVAYDELPRVWTESTLSMDALNFLRWLTPSQHRSFIIGQLVDLLPTMHDNMVGEVADHLLHVAFHWEEFELPPLVTREKLNTEQRAVLHAIAISDHLWSMDQESSNTLILNGIWQDLLFLGLPTTQQDLRAFLGLEP